MKNWQNYLLLLLMGVSNLYGQSTEGQDFWMGFMEHRDVGNNTKVLMLTGRENTTGEISIPRLNWNRSFTVQANDITLVELPSSAETTGSESIRSTGIHITSNADISVYAHQYFGYRSEAATILPTGSIGTEYYIMSYDGYSSGGEDFPSEFLIVATEDETTISFQVADNTIGGMAPGGAKTIMLDQGQTYQVQSNEGPSGDLTGSYVVADKAISVYGGNKWTQVPTGCATMDNLYEQMYPVNTWGKKFVMAPSRDASFDVVRILASEDNTDVFQDGSLVANLNAGNFYEAQVSGNAIYFEGSKPLLIAQYNIGRNCNSQSSVGDPSMVLLNSVEQTRDTFSVYSSSFENITVQYINIVAKTDDVSTISLDGNGVASNFQVVAGNPDYSYAQIVVNVGTHTLTSSGCGMIATAYGYGDAESYSYAGGASFRNINANPIPVGACLNDTVLFSTGLPEDRYAVTWDLGDGTITTEMEPTTIYTQLGTYPVELIVVDFCENKIDTFYQDLLVTLRQAVEAGNDTTVCEGQEVQLFATDLAGASYEWTGPNDYFSEEQFPVLSATDPSMSGTYSVIGIISGCATYPKVQEITFNAFPEIDLGEDTVICDGKGFYLNAGTHTTYRWQDGSGESQLFVGRPGDYTVVVTDDIGCASGDEINVKEQCPPRLFVPTAFTPNEDGRNDVLAVSATDMVSYRLQIFNRWGKMVFDTSNPTEYWDGSLPNGQKAPEGVYMYLATYDHENRDRTFFERQVKGFVTLLR
ncbi:MAG: gliding motility-associated C-terminal domain-containing protein [Bacteroidota bacterium]